MTAPVINRQQYLSKSPEQIAAEWVLIEQRRVKRGGVLIPSLDDLVSRLLEINTFETNPQAKTLHGLHDALTSYHLELGVALHAAGLIDQPPAS